MPTYLELKAQAEQLRQQAEQARLAELDIVLAEVRARVAEYALTAEQIFGRRRSASATRVGQDRIPARPGSSPGRRAARRLRRSRTTHRSV
ncbi:H-NS family nucleoid-associated regulatory protein, partial [Streptomyces sp. NPDC005566]|uniref:H-NS family nucleoid-associated regulatory protein n=1 Tax=Streptomyces sp. NPDC005566 TaxID=3156886 RepID=UPI0033B7CF1A